MPASISLPASTVNLVLLLQVTGEVEGQVLLPHPSIGFEREVVALMDEDTDDRVLGHGFVLLVREAHRCALPREASLVDEGVGRRCLAPLSNCLEISDDFCLSFVAFWEGPRATHEAEGDGEIGHM